MERSAALTAHDSPTRLVFAVRHLVPQEQGYFALTRAAKLQRLQTIASCLGLRSALIEDE
jgi:hypothetical protein